MGKLLHSGVRTVLNSFLLLCNQVPQLSIFPWCSLEILASKKMQQLCLEFASFFYVLTYQFRLLRNKFVPLRMKWRWHVSPQTRFWISERVVFCKTLFYVRRSNLVNTVIMLNSKEWWQYWPIYLTQNYCILIVSMSTFVPNIVFFSILVHVLYSVLWFFSFSTCPL